MSFTKRIIDLAKSNLNSLLEKAADTADPRRKLASIPDDELEAELARRKAARREEQDVRDAKARIDAGAPPGDREAREKAARDREAKVRASREARQRSQQAEAARTRQQAPPRPTGARTGQQQRPPHTPPPRPQPGTDLRKYYERLELPVGATFEEVKASYRRLMRKYHPDMHANKTPDKQKAANEVASALTQAYNELEKALTKGGGR